MWRLKNDQLIFSLDRDLWNTKVCSLERSGVSALWNKNPGVAQEVTVLLKYNNNLVKIESVLWNILILELPTCVNISEEFYKKVPCVMTVHSYASSSSSPHLSGAVPRGATRAHVRPSSLLRDYTVAAQISDTHTQSIMHRPDHVVSGVHAAPLLSQEQVWRPCC